MISFRTCAWVVASAFLAAAVVAAEPTNKTAAASAQSRRGVIVAAKTNVADKAQSVVMPGVGIPGEILFNTPSLEATWQDYRGRLALFALIDKRTDTPLLISQEAFTIIFADGHILRSSQMEAGSASMSALRPTTRAANAAERLGGQQATVSLSDPEGRVHATWKAVRREGADYLRQVITLTAAREVKISEIRLVSLQLDGAKVEGSVDGCPVVTDSMFFGVEHPMATNEIIGAKVHCSLVRPVTIKPGQSFEISSVIGAAAKGQMRRAFNTYVERERAHPYRTFLHYNSWYDIGYFSKYNEAAALAVVNKFGEELHTKRGVELSSFLFDDGWDDAKSLWGFHAGFPAGFANVRTAAEKFGAEPGVWMSPFGGYGKPKAERIKAGIAQGFETNASGFALSGPKYFARFSDTTKNFITQSGVNQFMFDGIGDAADATYPGSAFGSDFEAAIQLIKDLRAQKPDIFINLTTGTWPSPFWTKLADSIWRGGEDHSFDGVGSDRQKWITYRDADTYSNIVQGCSLYPLSSLMLHGLIYAQHAHNLSNDPSGAFTGEVHDYFGSGTQLQEMYITPTLLTPDNWNIIAEAAKWSRANAEVFADTHWIGGNPRALEVYGWAAWTPKKGVITLRNPSDKSADYQLDVGAAFELPAGAPAEYTLQSPWAADKEQHPQTAQAGTPLKITLEPFEVLNLDAYPPKIKPTPPGAYFTAPPPEKPVAPPPPKKEEKKPEPKAEKQADKKPELKKQI